MGEGVGNLTEAVVLEDLKYELEEETRAAARISIVGVGGCGCNAVAHMSAAGIDGAEFIAINTDFQSLENCPVAKKLALGGKVTRGRGAGADPEIAKQAALEDTQAIVDLLQGAELVFVTAGLGMGTGTGASPVVANLAREMGALTIAIVMKPFGFQGSKAARRAEQGLTELAAAVDAVIAIPNDRLLSLAPAGTSFIEAFRMGHEFLRQTIQDIVEIMTTPGVVNRDFADVRAAIAGSGYATFGAASASGPNAAVEAARQALASPLLDGAGIRGARNVLINIAGSSTLGLHDVNDACALIREAAGGEDVEINFGLVLNESLGDSAKVTVIATGFDARRSAEPEMPAPAFPEAPELPAPSGWLSEEQAHAAEASADPAPVEEPEPPALSAPPPPAPEPDWYEDELDRPAIERRRRFH
ncbi:MAG: cell division protein FtsZ [bacterium]